MKPLIGISTCVKPFGQFNMPNHAATDTYIRSVCDVAGCVPILFAACGTAADTETLLAHVDGIVLTGSRSNVRPSLYGGPPHADGTPEDPGRDSATLPMIRAAIAAGVPILAICRGMQELNVALGGTLHQRVQDLPGHFDHSTVMHPDVSVRTAKAHAIAITPGSWLHRVAGMRTALVNSLHNQGIDRLGSGLVVEATAPDGTIEAVRATATPALTIGVQWHPEADYRADPISRAIFEAFGDAVRARHAPAMLAAD